jgi:anti-sigma regulatory factor (Ser/Thr protein kinase)
MALDRSFDAGTLASLRKAALAEAAAAGMPRDRAADVMIAVHELAANAVRHGAGAGTLAMDVSDGRLYCQVSDAGPAGGNHPATAATRPWRVERGHGLWIVHTAADQVSVASGPAGFRVTAVFTIPGPPP